MGGRTASRMLSEQGECTLKKGWFSHHHAFSGVIVFVKREAVWKQHSFFGGDLMLAEKGGSTWPKKLCGTSAWCF
jgi:hypothetical protein